MQRLDMIQKAGVIGAGGAGFPTYAKLDCRIEYLLVNGAECEPLLRVDQQIMDVYAEQIIKGVCAAAEITGANKVMIGIKKKHEELICTMNREIGRLNADSVEIGELPDFYPAGDEMVLVYQLTGRVVPEAGIPKDVGCAVINAETCLNVYRAVFEDKPVTEKFITVTGDVEKPETRIVPIGTSIRELLEMQGVRPDSGVRVIRGGPMMGSVMEDPDGYVTKKDKGFIVLREDHPLIRKKLFKEESAVRVNRSACEQCRMCTDLCPRYLLGHNMQPHKMMRTLSYAPHETRLQVMAALCSQCNLCEYFSCPANLHPRMNNALLKKNLQQEKIRYQRTEDSFAPRESRPFRLVPSKRLIMRLGLKPFDTAAPLNMHRVEPAFVRIMLGQSIGAKPEPVVGINERVTKGQILADIGPGKLGTPVHASIDGYVTEITPDYISVKGGE